MSRISILIVLGLLAIEGCNSYPSITLSQPEPVTGLTVSPGNSTAVLSWNQNAPDDFVSSYSVFTATTSWSIWSNSLPGARVDSGIACCTFNAAGLQNETTYWFAVEAYDQRTDRFSDPSAKVFGKPPGWGGTLQTGTALSEVGFAVAVDQEGSLFVTGAAEATAFLTKFDASGGLTWTRQLGGASTTNAYDVAVDSVGNAYVAGFTEGDLDGFTFAGGASDAFVAKYDPTGTKLWTRMLGSVGDDRGIGLAISEGFVFVEGTTTAALHGNTPSGLTDLFIAKYEADGVRDWTIQMGTTSHDAGFGVAAANGRVYVSGYTFGTMVGAGNVSAGGVDAFVMKLDADNGAWFWTRQFGSSADDSPNSIAIDGNELYVAGSTYGALDVAPAAGQDDMFLAQFDVGNGDRLWTRQLGTSDYDRVEGIAAIGGAIYVAGSSYGDFEGDTNSGFGDAFLVRYDSAGGKRWSRLLGTDGDDFGGGVAADANGAVYVTGSVGGRLDGNIEYGGQDVFVVKYDSNGEKQVPP